MPTFRYVGDEPRHYPDPGLGPVQPGDERELECAPDHRWQPKTARKRKPTEDEPQGTSEPEEQ